MKLFCSPIMKAGAVAALGCLALVNLSTPAVAQMLPAFQPTPPTPEQAQAFLLLDLASQVLQSPLTITVQSLTLEDIADRVQKSLGMAKSNPKMTIQVRNARPVRLSFAAKDSTVGEVLRSSGTLAGVQLWIFSDHFLLAPEESLLPGEKKALAEGTMAKAPSNALERSRLVQSQQQSLASFISGELKGLQANRGVTGAPSNGITFDQFSPQSQAMLQVLLANTKDDFLQNPWILPEVNTVLASFSLSGNPIVGFGTPVQGNLPNTSLLQITFDKGTTSWSTEGTSTMVSTGVPPKPGSHLTPPFLDPSAGKS